MAASWSMVRAARLPRPFFVHLAQTQLDYRPAGHSTAPEIVVPDPVDKRVEDGQDSHQHPQALAARA